ncbi:MAG: cytochrome c1 [Legionella sp.]
MMKVWLYFFLFLLAHALNATEFRLLPIAIDLNNRDQLQRGAILFMNYCSGCHSLHYLRYNRMLTDLGFITQGNHSPSLIDKIMLTPEQRNNSIETSVLADEASRWFGASPPDLSLSARQRGPSWLYTYLKSFYIDRKRPFGSNNLLLVNVAMPNVLAPLQGQVINTHHLDEHNGLMTLESGELSEKEFDSVVRDLITFLVYVAEPARFVRQQIAMTVLIFLTILVWVTYKLKQDYWRDIG